MNLWEMLKASKGLPTDDYMALLFALKTGKNSVQNVTVSGVPCVLENSVGKPVISYKIYGNTVQNDTPTPENPVEVQSVGELVTDGENSGKYAVSVVCRSTNREPIKTNILLNEPLRKIGNYADFIDFESGKIVRNVGKKAFDGSEEISLHYTFASHSSFRLPVQSQVPVGSAVFSTHAENIDFLKLYSNGEYGICAHNKSFLSNLYVAMPDIKKLDDMKSFLKSEYEKGTPVTVYYQLAEPTEETAIFPEIPTFLGTATVEIDTEIQPSDMEITYKSRRKNNG